MKLSEQEFAELVTAALREIPAGLQPYLEDVVVDIEDRPDAETARSVEVDDPGELLGLYFGTPLTLRGLEGDYHQPDRIVIYRDNILSCCETHEEVIDEVRTTVLHEIGHHFGLDEEELEDLGYG